MQRTESSGRVSGFIDKDTEIKGDIKFKDSFRIDGKFKGKILSGGSLIVGETGDLEADVEAESISINGRVKGSLNAKDRIEIFSLGRVTGKIVAPKLIIEEGAFFQGSCQMELKALEGNKSESEDQIESRSEEEDQ
ncbi:MAG: polymer-forming cytoskeletal protein [Candidatus Aminicenantes bacterium]|nr:MAG: polymer-forming cytoskeletal protein [Candidatus Aminicenantes bacterium]